MANWRILVNQTSHERKANVQINQHSAKQAPTDLNNDRLIPINTNLTQFGIFGIVAGIYQFYLVLNKLYNSPKIRKYLTN